MLHIAEAIAEATKGKGLKKVVLLETKYTMAMESYKAILSNHGIETVVLDTAGIKMVNDIIYEEMAKGLFLPETIEKFIQLISAMQEQRVEGAILGCTEIPQLLQQKDISLPLFDTAYLHANAGVDFALTTN